jgi:hypothetical protein
MSGFLTYVRTADLSQDSSRPNKKGCSDLAFWIPIQTILKSWKTWKIRLGEVSYWDKTIPLYIYEGIMDD